MMRWICPTCGKGKQAPRNMKRDDVRRYCLPCSEKTGFLVRRESPRLVRERSKRKAVRAAKTAAKRTRRAVTKLSRVEAMKRYPLNLHTLKVAWGKLQTWECDLTKIPLNVRNGLSHAGTSGHAWSSGRMCVTAGFEACQGYMVLLHEMAHVAGWFRPRPARFQNHGVEFKSCLRRAAEELLGVTIGGMTTREINNEIAKAFQVEINAGRLPCWLPLKNSTKMPRVPRQLTDANGVLTLSLSQEARDELSELISRWTQYDPQVKDSQVPGATPNWGDIAAWVREFVTPDGMKIPVSMLTTEQKTNLALFASDMAGTGRSLKLKDLRRAGLQIRITLRPRQVSEQPVEVK